MSIMDMPATDVLRDMLHKLVIKKHKNARDYVLMGKWRDILNEREPTECHCNNCMGKYYDAEDDYKSDPNISLIED